MEFASYDLLENTLCSGARACPTLCSSMVCSLLILSMDFSKQDYWSGLPFPPPGELPNPEIELRSTELAGFTTEPPGKPSKMDYGVEKKKKSTFPQY